MNTKENKNIHEYFIEQSAVWYRIVVLFYALSYLIDIFSHLGILPKVILIADLITLLIIFFFLGLFIKKIITQKTSFLVMVYSGMITLFISYIYLLLHHSFTYGNIIQDLVTIPVIILSVGFLASKRHMVIIGIIFSIFYPFAMYLSGDKIMMESSLFISVILFGSTAGFFILTRTLENAMKLKEEATVELIRQKDELLKLNEERTKLFSIISHDLRNPVGNAKNVCEMLLDEDLEQNEKRELTEALHRMTARAYTLLEDLLDWANSESGMFAYNPEVIDLRSAVEKAIEFFSPNIKEKSLTVLNLIKNDTLVYSDKKILDTIIRNLLSNAIKFTYNNGEIVFSTIDTADKLTFVIKDNGMGMEADMIDDIFSNNKIVSSYGTNKEKGTGLGLQLVRNLVEKNNGEISIESIPRKGTSFFITIPYPPKVKNATVTANTEL